MDSIMLETIGLITVALVSLFLVGWFIWVSLCIKDLNKIHKKELKKLEESGE